MSPLEPDIVSKCGWVLSQQKRYKLLRGGRGSGKSWSVARYLILRAAFGKVRILCTREMQNSIRDSVYKLLVDQITDLKLEKFFVILNDGIYGIFGSEFIFKGLKHNVSGIRSTEGIDICWVEEAEVVSEDSWMLLTPTIRKKESEIIVSWNPEVDGSATDKRFCKFLPPNCAWVEVNHCDNKWFPEVLREEMEYDKRVDFEKYEHVWCGKYKQYADALIFKGKIRIEDFEEPPEGQVFHFGEDFGFSNDPSALLRMFIRDYKLYISHEAYGVGVEIGDLHQFNTSVPGANKWEIIADSQRPDTISFLSQAFTSKSGTTYPGFNIKGAEKGKGSVEDGIEFLRSFEAIVIHPRCRGSISDFTNYRWKVDKLTKAILPIPEDKSNHACDAARYGLERYIKGKISVFDINYKSVSMGPLGRLLSGT